MTIEDLKIEINRVLQSPIETPLTGTQLATLLKTMADELDEVSEFSTLTALPNPGKTGKIYVTLDTNFTYRWGGSSYIKINDIDISTKADLIAGKVPASQLPSYLDDVLEVANLVSLPVIGESGKIYVTIDTNLQYRWSGSTYIAIGGGIGTYLTKTQANLIDVGGDNWYLPWLDNTNQPIADVEIRPLIVEVNGIVMPINQLDRSFTPPRLYGNFQSNLELQTIKVLISKNITTSVPTVLWENILGNPKDNLPLQAKFDALDGGLSFYFEKTKAEIDTLISTNALVIGALYKISGVHPDLYNDGTNSGTTIYLIALTVNKLSSEGYGEFYNPRYFPDNNGYIWSNKSSYNISSIVGTFIENETITTEMGDTGVLFKIAQSGLFDLTSSGWNSDSNYFTGDISGARVNIYRPNNGIFQSPNGPAIMYGRPQIYPIIYHSTTTLNSSVIWGGYYWQNTGGTIGSSLDVLTLSPDNWIKIPYSNNAYNKVIDVIEYDIQYNIITRRKDNLGNDIICNYKDIVNFGYNTINRFQFGNRSFYNNKVYNSELECINVGNILTQNTSYKLSIHSNTLMSGSSIRSNYLVSPTLNLTNYFLVEGSSINSNYLTNGSSINSNTLVSSSIKSNYLTNGAQISNIAISEKLLQNNNISSVNISNILNTGTLLLNPNITKTFFRRPDGIVKISYYNNSDQLIIANLND